MSKTHLIENGVIVNTIIATVSEAEAAFPNLTAVDAELHPGAIGDGWNGSAVVKPQAPLPTLADYDKALVAHLDATAKARNYDDRISCAVRAGFPGPFQAEGIAFATWMDTCNQIGYSILADFQAGNIPQPTIAEVIDSLPPMVWP